jgi:hypothetical protein
MKNGQIISTKELSLLSTTPDFNYIAKKTIVFGMLPGTRTVVMTEEVSKGQLKVLSSMAITGDVMGNGMNRNQIEDKLFRSRQ